MAKYKTTIKIETDCTNVQATLWFPDGTSQSIPEALTPTGKVRQLDPGTYYVASSAVGQHPGTLVKATVSTVKNSKARTQRVSNNGTLAAQPAFVIDDTGAVS